MATVLRSARILPLAALASAVLALSACAGESNDERSVDAPVGFSTSALAVSAAHPGEVITVDVTGSPNALDAGFFVRFAEAGGTVDVPPFRVENGRAFVMVPGLSETQNSEVTLALLDSQGNVVAGNGPSLTITPIKTTLVITRELFNSAVGEGLARIVELAREAVTTLDQQGYVQDAQVALDALAQQQTLFRGIADFTSNLSDAELAMLQQILGNTKLLDFLASTGGVNLGGSASQSSPLSSVTMRLIESALLKADFASLLLGEARGMLSLISWVCTRLSGWPFIGSKAAKVATWAQGLAATLKTPHELINSMIPGDLVRVTASPTSLSILPSGTTSVRAKGRFETEAAFNTAWLQQLLTTYVQQAATTIQQQMQQSPVLSPYAQYVQQVAAMVPTWVLNWITARGLLSATVVPGSSYTVLALNNLELDMSQYRFDVPGIVANLINLPTNVVTTFFKWVGIGYGSPVGGYEGVKVNGPNAAYLPATDSLQHVSAGTTSATYIGVLCRPAGGWWAKWGFYAAKASTANVTVICN
ncbi:MAG: hypothetical protein IT463_05730 [Planctomycetes bacterium]|nr:hypothetical protein [Planctomycetota bacterium]